MRCNSPRDNARQPFLEPPHSHDPEEVPSVTALPTSLLAQLPTEVQHSVSDLQESTSIAYASYARLQNLLDERFERLLPGMRPDGRRFSESSFFNYRNHLQAEKAYLLSDALPDWRHKASFTKSVIRPYSSLSDPAPRSDSPRSVDEWWSSLQTTVSSWLDHAKKINIPDFEDTIKEYLAGRQAAAVYDSQEASPLESPANEDERSFSPTNLTSFDIEAKNYPAINGPGKRLDSRKDSAICIDD